MNALSSYFKKFILFSVFSVLSFQAFARPGDYVDPNLINRSELPKIPFKTPDLSDENIIEVLYDVRPFRNSGVRLEPEYYKDKLIIHNYGYGGCGLTLCFGAALEVATILQKQQEKDIHWQGKNTVAVLGAGIIGLATAYELSEKGYNVTIYSDTFYPENTSYIAAGIWTAPFYRETKNGQEKRELYQRLLYNSEQRYFKSLGKNPEFQGVYFSDYYIFKGFLTYQRLAKYGNQNADKRRYLIGEFENGLSCDGTSVKMIRMDSKRFISDIIQKLQSRGVECKKRRFHSQEELLKLNQDIVINCMSLGSKEVFGDTEFRPVQGHMIHFKNPKKINYTAFFPVPEDPYYWISINTWEDRLILGGVIEQDHNEKAFNPEVKEKLLKYARDLFMNTR